MNGIAKVKPHTCHICNKGFGRRFNLKRHIENIHRVHHTAIMTLQDLHQLVAYIYADRINQIFKSLVKERCVGCHQEHPSQKHHLCIDPESDALAPVLFELASERVGKFDLKLLFIESSNNLFLDYKLVNFDQYLKELIDYWKQTEWSSFNESSSKVPEAMEMAVLSARMKLVLLEKRVNRRAV